MSGFRDVPLTKEQIDAIFEQYEESEFPPIGYQGSIIIALHQHVYGEKWHEVKMLQDFPKCSDATSTYIYEHFMPLDKKHNIQDAQNGGNGVVQGGAWMNRGFSVDRNMGDWFVEPAPYTNLKGEVITK